MTRDLKDHEIFEGTWTQLVREETSSFASCSSQTQPSWSALSSDANGIT